MYSARAGIVRRTTRLSGGYVSGVVLAVSFAIAITDSFLPTRRFACLNLQLLVRIRPFHVDVTVRCACCHLFRIEPASADIRSAICFPVETALRAPAEG